MHDLPVHQSALAVQELQQASYTRQDHLNAAVWVPAPGARHKHRDRTVGLVSSNWSAPNALTLGLMPPVPRATTYREKNSSPFCHQVAFCP